MELIILIFFELFILPIYEFNAVALNICKLWKVIKFDNSILKAAVSKSD